MWQSKDYMKVWRVNNFGPAFVYPYFFVYSLTVRTTTVTAGIIVEFQMPAVSTLTDVTAKPAGFAIQYSMSSSFLLTR